MSEGVVRAAEDAVVRDPDAVGHWTAYLSARRDAGWAVRRAVFERAVRHAPGSYKLWSMYLREQRVRLRGRRGQSSEVGRAVGVFERALVYMHKMPRVWIMYGEVLEECGMASAFRRAMDRALCALPVTQHDRIWTLYLAFVEKFPKEIWQVGVQVFPRYLEFQPRERERYVEYLLAARQFDRAIEQLSAIVQDKNFVSVKGRTAHSLWMQLCTLVVQHADKVQKMGKARLDAERLIRAGLGRFTDETGRLWCSLAEYYVRIGQFDKAQEIYEEGVHAVNTVRDFSTIFDAYTQFHEGMLNAKIDLFGDDEEQKDDQETQHAFYDINMDAEDKINDVDLRLALMEQLIEERPFLLSAVLLRQNPHNCEEWHKRAGLYRAKDDMASVVETYKDAVAKLDPARAVGSPYTLWTELARVYEDHGNVEEAREVFRTATGHNFVDVDDLVHIYCAFAEMEIRQGDFGAALNLVRGSVSKGKPLRVSDKPSIADQASKLHRRLQRSTLLWSLYADLEESLGSLRSARAAYDRMLELKVATPQTILNYAAMLEENKFFEDAFQAYERGVALFSWPHVGDIWITYLFKFAERYKGEKMFRLREMYEQAVGGAPSDKCRPLYLMLSKVEEEFGNPRRALSALDRLCSAAPVEERGDLFLLYIGKAEELFGISRAREVFELAINQLEDPSQVRELCLHYAEKERRLGEIDRARSILRHGAQFADPRTVITYWRTWNDFEVAHGNEDTFREMLRVKRTIQVQYNDTNYSLASNARGKGPHAHGSNSSKAKGHFESATPATSTGAVNAPGGGSQLAEEENKRHLDPSERGDDHFKRPKLGDSNDAPIGTAKSVMDNDNDDDEVSVQAVPRSVFGGATA